VRHQRVAATVALKAGEEIDALELDVVGAQVRERKIGRGEQAVANGRFAGLGDGECGAGFWVRQILDVDVGCVLFVAVRNDRGAVERSGEGLEERRRADEREG
jgi:hypothetical protein